MEPQTLRVGLTPSSCYTQASSQLAPPNSGVLIRTASLRFQVCSYLGGHPEGGAYGGVPPQTGVRQLGGDSCREEKLQVSLRLQEPFTSATIAKARMRKNVNWSDKDV